MNNQIKRQLLLSTYLNDNSSPYFKRLAMTQLENMNDELHGAAIPLNITKEDIHELIKKYAPIHWLHTNGLNPVNVEDIADKFKLEKRGNDNYLTMKETLSSPSASLPWFKGNPDLDKVNTYIFVRPHKLGFQLVFNVNFAYNVGKNIKLINSRMGNHVFDACQSYIVFNENKEPILLGAQSHSHRPFWKWGINEGPQGMAAQYDRRNLYQEYENGLKPVFFHAERSSELYAFPIKYTYKKTALFKLIDYMNKGRKYNTGNKYILIFPEHYYGLSNVTENEKGESVSLALPSLGVNNWVSDIAFIGADKRGEIKIPFSKSQYRLTPHVRQKGDEYKMFEKRENIVPTEYLDLKRAELELKQ